MAISIVLINAYIKAKAKKKKRQFSFLTTRRLPYGSEFSSRCIMRSEKHICAPSRLSEVFSQRRPWYSSSDRLIDDVPLSSFQERSSSASSLHASLLQAIDGVMSLVLCPRVVSQAPQHFRSSEKQATCEGTPTGPFEGGCLPLTHSSLDFPLLLSLSAARLLNLWEWCDVWSHCHFRRQSSGGPGWLLPPRLSSWGWDRIGCTVFTDGGRTLLDNEAPPWPVFGGWWFISVHYEVLRFAVFLIEKLDLWRCFSCWPFSTVLS